MCGQGGWTKVVGRGGGQTNEGEQSGGQVGLSGGQVELSGGQMRV